MGNLLTYLITRRRLLGGTAVIAGLAIVAKFTHFVSPARAQEPKKMPVNRDPSMLTTRLTINGDPHEMTLDSRTTLLDALREQLHFTGTKKGCDHGQCGACTVIADGRRINSCMTLAAMQDGANITTIEGLGTVENLHPMQAAFVKHDGFQCGYCTPGQICSAVSVLTELKQGMPSHVTKSLTDKIAFSDDEIRERMSGNLCRCAAYPNILAAIRDVAGENVA